jgi:hypothetical protein
MAVVIGVLRETVANETRVIGAGVAGLQAIATARRLGAVVEAYDVRAATKDQVKSLGAKFVETGVSAEGTGGYARELTADEKLKQQEVLDARIAASDANDLISDLDEINAEFETADVALIIGANDVVNPDARTNKGSPIYGMPILNADKARNVMIKRGQRHGFSGIDNALFGLDQTRMLYGDAQAAVSQLIQAVKAAG